MLTKIVSALLCSFNEKIGKPFFLKQVDPRSFYFFLDVFRIKKVKSPHALVDISKESKCANFQRRVNSTWAIASKSYFLKQKTQFLENKLSKHKYKIHPKASIIK